MSRGSRENPEKTSRGVARRSLRCLPRHDTWWQSHSECRSLFCAVSRGCSAPGPALLAVDAGPVDARVHALLREDPYVRCGRRLLLVVAGGLALSATLLADPLHHAVETVLHVLVG